MTASLVTASLVTGGGASVPGVPVPSWAGVALSLLLVGVSAAVIWRERLGLVGELAIGVVRAAVQLVAVGYALRVLFVHAGLPGSLAWVVGMVVVAGRVSGGRGRGLPSARWVATAAVGTGTAATLGLLVGAGVIVAEPRVVVPIGGMVVSAAMQGTTLVLLRLRDEVTSSRQLVEARLVLGLPGRAALAPHVHRALRTALTPGVDAAKVVGLITLPGAMTGLIIAGVSPSTAIRYQIVVAYMGLGATAIAGLVASRLMARALFDDAHRLRELAAPRAGVAVLAGWRWPAGAARRTAA